MDDGVLFYVKYHNFYIWSEVYKLFDLIHLILCFTLQVHLNIDLKKYAKCLNSRYLYFVDMLVKVAFTATRTLSQSFTTETAVVFSNILTNIGGGYNAVTGIFTAPLGGIYLFDCKLTDNQNRDGTSIFFCEEWSIPGFSRRQRWTYKLVQVLIQFDCVRAYSWRYGLVESLRSFFFSHKNYNWRANINRVFAVIFAIEILDID